MDLFALEATHEFGLKVAHELNIVLAAHEEREFEDGEHKARPLVSVRGHDVYVIQSLHSGPVASVNDKFCRLLFFIGALKEWRQAGDGRHPLPSLCAQRPADEASRPGHDPLFGASTRGRWCRRRSDARSAQYRGVSERLPLSDDPS
jgi:ribose-phosphate pyrophosphokinase